MFDDFLPLPMEVELTDRIQIVRKRLGVKEPINQNEINKLLDKITKTLNKQNYKKPLARTKGVNRKPRTLKDFKVSPSMLEMAKSMIIKGEGIDFTALTLDISRYGLKHTFKINGFDYAKYIKAGTKKSKGI